MTENVILIIGEFIKFYSSFIGTNCGDDAHDGKLNLKSDSTKDDKNNITAHPNDEVSTHENGHSNERIDSSQSVSMLLSKGSFLLLLLKK